MKVLDVNVFVAAFRPDHQHHRPARDWLEKVVGMAERFSVPDSVAGSFLRVVTSRRIQKDPNTLDEAFAYLRALRARANHVLVAPGPVHLDILERLCRSSDAVGDLVPDAQLAAIAVEHGGTVVSFDRDFARFDGLRWERPE